VKAILDMVEEYANTKDSRIQFIPVNNGACICAKLPDEVRRRLSALYSAKDFPRESVKECSECRLTLPRSEFHKNPGTKDGRQSACKECRNRRQRKLRVARRLARSGAIIGTDWFDSDAPFDDFE